MKNVILNYKKVVLWSIVTGTVWTIGLMTHTQSEHLITPIAHRITTPIVIATIGLAQSLLFWSRPTLRNTWLKMIAIQVGLATILQLVMMVIAFFCALFSIAVLGKGHHWSTFSEMATIVQLIFGLISHGFIQSWGIRQNWPDRSSIILTAQQDYLDRPNPV